MRTTVTYRGRRKTRSIPEKGGFYEAAGEHAIARADALGDNYERVTGETGGFQYPAIHSNQAKLKALANVLALAMRMRDCE